MDTFIILKNYSGIAVRCRCRAGFDPERSVEQCIIHISSYLARLFPSETEAVTVNITIYVVNITITVKKNLFPANYFVSLTNGRKKKVYLEI